MANNIRYHRDYNLYAINDDTPGGWSVLMNAAEINAGVEYIQYAWEELGEATVISGDPLPYREQVNEQQGASDGI